MADRITWQSDCLWSRLKAQREHGLQQGALQPIATTCEYLEADNIRFWVRVLASLSHKEKARKQQGKTAPANPFLPYERDLYVTDVSATHLCLLNKFNVVDHHFLIVTRQFESQENWLTLADFEALVLCLSEVEGLAFFNGGKTAGASQPHKHLQVVPYTETVSNFPMETAIATAQAKERGALTSSQLPFRHAIAHFSPSPQSNEAATGKALSAQNYLRQYHQLLSSVGITSTNHWQDQQTSAYNLICTRQWMMIIPRRQESYANISVNALGFAGSLLVRDEESLARLKSIGVMQLLQQVSWPK